MAYRERGNRDDRGNRGGPPWPTIQTGRYSGLHPNQANRPKTHRSYGRPSPKPKKPKGPAVNPPREIRSGKDCKRMMKATAFRLARIIRARPAAVMAHPNPIKLLEHLLKHRSIARNLARRLVRLRDWYESA